jgi:hypothetical protein
MRLLLALALLFSFVDSQAQIYEVLNGKVHFHSNTPQELIRAESNQLRGALDLSRNTFAFRVRINTFQGFNSPLQQEHFNENYMESARIPEAFFTGKIIEDVDLRKEGTYLVRAKGKMQIHGFSQECIIEARVQSVNNRIDISSDFSVFLADYSIKIPRLIYDKLSPEIKVSVQASLRPRP